jgi:glycosyltransferase involved in cell wall biosynthesis
LETGFERSVSREPLTVAWISDFPVEWLAEVPAPLRGLPRRHPATWQMVLLSEFQKEPALRLHVVLLRSRIERSFRFEQGGTTFHVLKAPAWARLASLFWADTLLIRAALKRVEPALVHAWGIEKGATVIGPRLGYRCVTTVQGLLGWYKTQVPLPRYDQFLEPLERRSLPRARVVTTESRVAVQFLRERYPGLDVCQAEHAPNRAFFQVRREPVAQPAHFISIGTLGHRKGTDLLLKGLDSLVGKLPFRLTLVCGPEQGYLDTLRAETSPALWERVEVKTHLLPHEVASALARPTMLLLPTRADTSPNAVKEAVVAGVPVVASDVGGIPDYVFPGENGLLFPRGDLAAFIQAVTAACAHPRFGAGLVAPETLTKVRDYLSPARMAENFMAAYRRALADRVAKPRTSADANARSEKM